MLIPITARAIFIHQDRDRYHPDYQSNDIARHGRPEFEKTLRYKRCGYDVYSREDRSDSLFINRKCSVNERYDGMEMLVLSIP